MTRTLSPKLDPAHDTATVLRRIGVLTLMVGLPLAAPAARTGPVFAFAIGIALLGTAALFDGAWRPARDALVELVSAPAFLAGALVAGWALLSIIWAPPSRQTGATAFGLAAILGLGLAGLLALPERMRSANLYPIPIGTAALALAGIALAAGASGEGAPDVARRLGRGLAVLVLFAWPAIAWLRSRDRDGQAIGLAVVVAGAAALGPSAVPALALAAGAVAYVLAQIFPRGAFALGIGVALLIVLAPVLVVVPGGGGPETIRAWQAGLSAWRGTLLDEPLRLVTGHGFGALRPDPGRTTPPEVFGAPVLVLWYELGLVGVVGSAAALALALRAVAARFGPLVPGVAAAVATAVVLALAGTDGGALWWPATLAALALILVATQRGQFRTRRPRALGLGRGRAA